MPTIPMAREELKYKHQIFDRQMNSRVVPCYIADFNFCFGRCCIGMIGGQAVAFRYYIFANGGFLLELIFNLSRVPTVMWRHTSTNRFSKRQDVHGFRVAESRVVFQKFTPSLVAMNPPYITP